MPETSLRGRNTLTALRVLRSTEMFMWAPAAARILNVENTNPHKQKTETESRIVTWLPIIHQHCSTSVLNVMVWRATKRTENNIRFLVFWLFPCMCVWEDGCDKCYLGGEQRIGPRQDTVDWRQAHKNTSYRQRSFICYTKTRFFTKFHLHIVLFSLLSSLQASEWWERNAVLGDPCPRFLIKSDFLPPVSLKSLILPFISGLFFHLFLTSFSIIVHL